MFGAAFLLLGLLLVLTGLISPRLGGARGGASPSGDSGAEGGAAAAQGAPQGGIFAPRWTSQPIRAFLLSPVDRASWCSAGAIFSGFFVTTLTFVVLVSLMTTGMGLLFFGVGVIMVGLSIEGARVFARFERRRVGWADSRPLVAHPYRPYGHDLRDLFYAIFLDVNRWRDVVYVAVSFPLAIIEFVVAIGPWVATLVLITAPVWFPVPPAEPAVVTGFVGTEGRVSVLMVAIGLAFLPIAATISQGLMALHRAVVAGLLCVSESRALQRRVETLTESRSAILDVEASELRRIERDLHDGAQQRLVMLTIDLSLADERIEGDPEQARKLVLDAREQARQALAELRDLVRGIAPAILLDRGLVAALSAIAGRCPVPTSVDSSLPAEPRPPVAVERAAYFVVAEALANVAKHSAAARCEIRCRAESGRLVVEVWDDGKGGAKVTPGGGLAGLAGRAEALDGSLTVTSPEGGPTLLHAEFPLTTAIAPAAAAARPSARATHDARQPARV